jgi:uncharacterized protein (DUF1330 family)
MFSLRTFIPEYKLYADEVGDYIQKCGGEFYLRKHDVEFVVEEKYREFVLIKYPFLEQVPLVY